jgi:hypothetical protein
VPYYSNVLMSSLLLELGVANMATLAYRFMIVGENIIFTSSIFIMLPPRPNQSSEFGAVPGENELIAFSTRPD